MVQEQMIETRPSRGTAMLGKAFGAQRRRLNQVTVCGSSDSAGSGATELEDKATGELSMIRLSESMAVRIDDAVCRQ